MSYPKIQITNNIENYTASGVVILEVCSDHSFSNVGYGDTWTSPDRHFCLISAITATLSSPGQPDISVVPFKSDGTDASQFSIVNDAGTYKVVEA